MKFLVILTLVSLLSFCSSSMLAQAQEVERRQLENKTQENELGIIGPVRIHVIAETGALVVVGENAEDVEKVKALIQKIIQSAQSGRPKSEIIRLKWAHAKLAAARAQHLYDLNFLARQGAVTISAQNQSDLLILGSAAAIGEVKKIVKLLDR